EPGELPLDARDEAREVKARVADTGHDNYAPCNAGDDGRWLGHAPAMRAWRSADRQRAEHDHHCGPRGAEQTVSHTFRHARQYGRRTPIVTFYRSATRL